MENCFTQIWRACKRQKLFMIVIRPFVCNYLGEFNFKFSQLRIRQRTIWLHKTYKANPSGNLVLKWSWLLFVKSRELIFHSLGYKYFLVKLKTPFKRKVFFQCRNFPFLLLYLKHNVYLHLGVFFLQEKCTFLNLIKILFSNYIAFTTLTLFWLMI